MVIRRIATNKHSSFMTTGVRSASQESGWIFKSTSDLRLQWWETLDSYMVYRASVAIQELRLFQDLLYKD